MDIGMLWFDDDPQSDLLSKVNKAARYYAEKYNEKPDLCFVHPSMLKEAILVAGDITICPNSAMLPHHFWIGTKQEQLVPSQLTHG